MANGEGAIDLYTVDKQKYLEQGLIYDGVTISDLIKADYNDEHETKILKAVDMIEEALKDPKAKVLLTCHGGMSRSATVLICYLMLKQKKSVEDAITELRQVREIVPSKQQLIYVAKLHNKLHGFENIDVMDGNCQEMSAFRETFIEKEKLTPISLDKLYKYMLSIEPKERLIEYETELPYDPELKKKMLETPKDKIVDFCLENLVSVDLQPY